MVEVTDNLINYFIKLRQFPFVAQTEKRNGLGIKVVTQFYVDERGNTFSDTEN